MQFIKTALLQFEVYAFKQVRPIGLESIASLYIKGLLLTPNV